MDVRSPLVSIALPVYNGERFLADAIESLLGQTFTDLELVISDNASTDSTESIARHYVEADSRVRYIRGNTNRGAAPNYNSSFRACSARYFKWAAFDDVYAPTYLERCVEVLDRDPDVVLCHSRTVDIDAGGQFVRRWNDDLRTVHKEAHIRFRDLVAADHECFQAFGLIRMDRLRQTGLIGAYPDSDRVLLAELALHGRLYNVPEELFLHREHSGRSMRTHPRSRDRAEWFDTASKGKLVFPAWRLGYEFLLAVGRAPLSPVEQAHCYAEMRIWISRNWLRMAKNVVRTSVDGIQHLIYRRSPSRIIRLRSNA